MIVHKTSLYPIIALPLLLYTEVFLRTQFLAPYFAPCILSLFPPLLPHFITHHSFADDLQLQMSAPLSKYRRYFTLCSRVFVMSKLAQLRICLNLMTTRQISCLSPQNELSISITYLHRSPLAMLKFSLNSM